MRVGDNAHYAEGSILNSRKRGRGGDRRKEGNRGKVRVGEDMEFAVWKKKVSVYCVHIGCLNF